MRKNGNVFITENTSFTNVKSVGKSGSCRKDILILSATENNIHIPLTKNAEKTALAEMR